MYRRRNAQRKSISLLNVEGKIFFAVLLSRMTSYVVDFGYVDTSVQKRGIPGFPGCLEHTRAHFECKIREGYIIVAKSTPVSSHN